MTLEKMLTYERLDGIKQGIEQGLERGAILKAQQTAKQLLQMGLTIEQIAKAVNLPQSEIEALR